jgi:hypothetical protein
MPLLFLSFNLPPEVLFSVLQIPVRRSKEGTRQSSPGNTHQLCDKGWRIISFDEVQCQRGTGSRYQRGQFSIRIIIGKINIILYVIFCLFVQIKKYQLTSSPKLDMINFSDSMR